jgi:tetratricopeptide (TPR) repeat protein
MGMVEQSLQQMVAATIRAEQRLDSCSPDLALQFSRLGALYLSLSKMDKAEEYFQKCLDIEKKILDPMAPELATTYSWMGTLYHNQGDLAGAEQYYKKCLYIWER